MKSRGTNKRDMSFFLFSGSEWDNTSRGTTVLPPTTPENSKVLANFWQPKKREERFFLDVYLYDCCCLQLIYLYPFLPLY